MEAIKSECTDVRFPILILEPDSKNYLPSYIMLNEDSIDTQVIFNVVARIVAGIGLCITCSVRCSGMCSVACSVTYGVICSVRCSY